MLSFPRQVQSGFVRRELDKAKAVGGEEEGEHPALGTFRGVYMPCLQNILGSIPFIRVPWVGSQAGILYGAILIATCISTSIPTILSMSAIATNGRIPAGGPYYVVTRSLGASFGGAIGFFFFIGTALAGTMDALGAAETFQVGFDQSNWFPLDRGIVALGLVLVSGLLVYVGIKWVNRFASVFLVILLLSVALALGGLIAFGSGADFGDTDQLEPAKEIAWMPQYTRDPETGVMPNFQVLVSIFYPGFVGIMAGSNRSAMLADPAKSIPKGSMGAILTVTALYLTTIVLFNILMSREVVLQNKLVMAACGWPSETVLVVGIVISAYGSSLQAIVSAPQLLAAMFADDVLPFNSTWDSIRDSAFCQSCLGKRSSAQQADRHRRQAMASATQSGMRPLPSSTMYDRVAIEAARRKGHYRQHSGDRKHSNRRASRAASPVRGDPSRRNSLDALSPAFEADRQQRAEGLAIAAPRSHSVQVDPKSGMLEMTPLSSPFIAEDDDATPGSSGGSHPPEGEYHAPVAGSPPMNLNGGGGDDDVVVPVVPARGEWHDGRNEEAGVNTSNRVNDGDDTRRERGYDDGEEEEDGETEDAPLATAGFTEIAFTSVLAGLPCLAGNLDNITPILTMFFLMMYGTVNIACLLLTLFAAAGFRPTRPTHWVVSLFGVLTCVAVMILVSWWQALIGVLLAVGFYYWIDNTEQHKLWSEWGAGIDSMRLGQAHRTLVELRDMQFTARNWRPQLLLLVETDDNGEPLRPELLGLVSELQDAQTLTIATTVKRERLARLVDERSRGRTSIGQLVASRQQTLQRALDHAQVYGFAQALLSDEPLEGFMAASQTLGLGPLRPNTVLTGWPRRWREDPARSEDYVRFLKASLEMHKSLMIYKCDPGFATPAYSNRRETGTIDLWWMMRDSGLILLIPFLLRKDPVWAQCKLRLFVVDSEVQGRKDEVEQYLSNIGIDAEVHVVAVEQSVLEMVRGRGGPNDDVAPEDRAAWLQSVGIDPSSDSVQQSSMTLAARGVGRTVRREALGGRGLTSLFAGGTGDHGGNDPQGGAQGNPQGDRAAVPARWTDGEQDNDPTNDYAGAAGMDEEMGGGTFAQSSRLMNEHLRRHSAGAALVIANLMLTKAVDWQEFMTDVDIFTEGIPRLILLRGTGREIVTVYA